MDSEFNTWMNRIGDILEQKYGTRDGLLDAPWKEWFEQKRSPEKACDEASDLWENWLENLR